MIGLLVFLVCVFILILIVKAIIEAAVEPPQRVVVTKIAMLVILLFAILWLAGFGGWDYTRNFHPWARG